MFVWNLNDKKPTDNIEDFHIWENWTHINPDVIEKEIQQHNRKYLDNVILYEFKVSDARKVQSENNKIIAELNDFCVNFNIDGGFLKLTSKENTHVASFTMCAPEGQVNICHWDKCILSHIYRDDLFYQAL